jgi:hypothetical protein
MKQRLILKETECYIPDTTWWKYLSGIKPDEFSQIPYSNRREENGYGLWLRRFGCNSKSRRHWSGLALTI